MSHLDLFGRVSTADDGARSALDYYATPTWMTESLLRHHPAIAGTAVLEPCSGDDAISDVLRGAGCRVYTNDIDQRHPAQTHLDATQPDLWQMPRTDWVVSNFPFDLAFQILEQALPFAKIGVALLLRKTFLEPTEERGAWLSQHPPSRSIGLQRYRFRGDSTDSVSTDWFIWERYRDTRLAPFVIDHMARDYRRLKEYRR